MDQGQDGHFILSVDGTNVYLYFFMSRMLAFIAAVLQATANYRRTVTALVMNFLSYATFEEVRAMVLMFQIFLDFMPFRMINS